MIEKATSASNIASMLQTLKAAQAQASGGVQGMQPNTGVNETAKPSFLEAVRGAVEQVNATQQASASLREGFERGEDTLDEDHVAAGGPGEGLHFADEDVSGDEAVDTGLFDG